ncbi:MAG: 16S rRNA (guanine(966)-N(2))-methyltransferase RsmD [Alphaproteobacteria bacterium]
MRIVAGRHRGRNIIAPDGNEIRPTSDRVRESVFNILEHRDWGTGGVSVLSGARVLDAFCGTGACGLEALSRGAAHVSFLDNTNSALDLCRRNIAALKEQERTEILRSDCLKPVRPALPFDLVFMDPPYNKNLAARALQALANAGWMAAKAICVVESGLSEEIPALNDFALLEDRQYGSTRIRIFQHTKAADDI